MSKIKKLQLVRQGVPYFDLVEMGLPEVPLTDTEVQIECEYSAIVEAARSGPVAVNMATSSGTFIGLMSPVMNEDVCQLSGLFVDYTTGSAVPCAASVICMNGYITARIAPLVLAEVESEGEDLPTMFECYHDLDEDAGEYTRLVIESDIDTFMASLNRYVVTGEMHIGDLTNGVAQGYELTEDELRIDTDSGDYGVYITEGETYGQPSGEYYILFVG